MRKNYEKPSIAVMKMQPLALCDLSFGGSGSGRPAEAPRYDNLQKTLNKKYLGQQFDYADEELEAENDD